jgi:chemotaxis protein methyltransferase CheR
MLKSATTQNLLAPGDYQALQRFLEDASGIVLGDSKEYLVSSRLGRILREHGLATIGELLSKIDGGRNPGMRREIVDAMTTNETFWFRDRTHFDIFTQETLSAARGPVRVWSAACSSGQEPYNISMAVEDYIAANRLRPVPSVEILGTDISSKMLAEARGARYCGISASRGVSVEEKQRYFDADGDCLQVKPGIRRRVSFREFNLTQGFEALGRFDAVFCRNVLIYFSSDQKKDIIGRIARALKPGGFLFLGSTESILAHNDLLEMVHSHGGIGYRLR